MDLGRRSWFLILLSVAYLGIGYGAFTQGLARPPIFIHEIFPAWARLAIYVIGAAFGLAGAFMRNHAKLEIYGFVGLCIPVAIRTVSYFIGSIEAIFDPPDRYYLLTQGPSGFFTYGLIVVIIMVVASWPEPHPELISVKSKYIKLEQEGDS